MEDRPYRLTVELPGSGTFDAEGPEAAVRTDYGRFIDALIALNGSKAGAHTTAGANGHREEPASRETKEDAAPEQTAIPATGGSPPWQSPVDEELLRRVYAVNNGSVSLLVLPRTSQAAADAVMLVIYGFRARVAQPTVGADDLIAAVRQSGVPLPRLDKVLMPLLGEFVTKAGFKRGSRYGLTNKGLVRIEDLIGKLGV
jgi:hypothetical protein